jgi:hypothetical protein
VLWPKYTEVIEPVLRLGIAEAEPCARVGRALDEGHTEAVACNGDDPGPLRGILRGGDRRVGDSEAREGPKARPHTAGDTVEPRRRTPHCHRPCGR